MVKLRPNLSYDQPEITRPMPLKIEIRPTTVAIVPPEISLPTSSAIPLACETMQRPAALRTIAQR